MSAPGGAGAALGKEPVAPAGGRRRRKPGGRERRTNLRMTEDEQDKLTKLAAEAGVSIPRFLIESALGGGVKPSQRRIMVTELLAAKNQVAGAANNLNQLARWANTNEAYPPGADRAAEALADALERLSVAVDRVEL